jgi:two-component system, LytTR family, response regulator
MKANVRARMRVLIVDDEPLARDCVRDVLSRESDVEIIGECEDGERAIAAIRRLDPDLVFLDVQMPGTDGFGVVASIGVENMPATVFVTAYDEHALRAFEVHALDYVLKPFDDARFRDALVHARRRLHTEREGELARRINGLLQHLGRGAMSSDEYLDRIMVRERERIRFVPTEDVDWLESEGNYVRLHTAAGKHLIRASLSGMLERLDPRRFVRIHRSTIVNVERIKEMQPWVGGDYIVLLNDGSKLRVSRSYRHELLDRRVG